MSEALRLWFLAFYGAGVLVLIAKVLPAAFAVHAVQRRVTDLRRFLPALFLPFDWVLPPLFILLRVGEIHADWLPVRLFGFLLSVYAAVMLLWVAAALGRFLVPQAVIHQDHALVTAGPFRFVRHPAYSGDLALWLGAALGTLNVLLLALWPIAWVGSFVQASAEERLLVSTFGTAYETYGRRIGRFVPRLVGSDRGC
jgi:protein-S-isoprenylcysteine O-methyltransferase Ste14